MSQSEREREKGKEVISRDDARINGTVEWQSSRAKDQESKKKKSNVQGSTVIAMIGLME